jgi:hypothetical protein
MIRFHHHSPLFAFPFFKNNFNRFHCSIFIQVYKVHQPYSPSFNFSSHHLPIRTHTVTGPVYIPVLHFWNLCTFFQEVSPPLFSSSPIIEQFSGCFVMPSSYTDAIYFNIIHSLSFSFPLPPLPNPLKKSYYWKCIMHIYIYIYISVLCLCLCIHLSLYLSSANEMKYATVFFLKLA